MAWIEIPPARGFVPRVSVEQMREVDDLMPRRYGIDMARMMETAGRHLAELAVARFNGGYTEGFAVLVAAGSGGNGGGALVAARNLHNWGAQVRVVLTRPPKEYRDVPAQQLSIAERVGIEICEINSLDRNGIGLVIDGIIGYSLSGTPRGKAAALIGLFRDQGAPILSLDVPSGVDAQSGTVHEPAIRADATMTLALPKRGLDKMQARRCTGELYLADIGVPPQLFSALRNPIDAGHVFRKGRIVRIW